MNSVDLDAALQRDAMPVNSAVEPALEEGVVINEVLRPSHHGPCVTFSKFVERLAVGVRLAAGLCIKAPLWNGNDRSLSDRHDDNPIPLDQHRDTEAQNATVLYVGYIMILNVAFERRQFRPTSG